MAAVFAGLKVTAECRSPAELDRRHDATLHAAEMTVVGGTISRAMAAEYIRYLQVGTHGRGSGARHHLEGQAVERALRLRDHRCRDLRIASCGREVVVPQQHLNDADVDAVLEQVGGKAMAQRVHADALDEAGGLGRGPAGSMKHLDVDRLVASPREQPRLGTSKSPIGPQDLEELRRKHDRAILGALAVADLDQLTITVDISDLQADRLRRAKSGGISGRQCGARLERRHGFQEPDHLFGAQNIRQLARCPGVGDPLRNLGAVERDTVEEAQRTHCLVQRRPGNTLRYEINLKRPHVLQAELIR